MGPDRARSGMIARRLVGVSLALVVLVAAFGSNAGAVSQGDVNKAKAAVAALKRQIDAAKAKLAGLEAHAATLAEQVFTATDKLRAIQEQLRATQLRLEAAKARYDAVEARLNARARQVYIDGPGSSLEFLLGATSLTDLSDRLEFVNALTQTDADLANQVQNLKNQLTAQEKQQESLQALQAKVVNALRSQQAQLNAQVAEQQRITNAIAFKEKKAKAYAAKVSKEFLRELSFGGHVGTGTFKVCPVGQPHIVTDSFGAPRYSGGYHLHMGDDIMAPEGVAIYAPFDGNAVDASNGLGGNAVIVYGSEGYVYNAHLSSFGQLGSVSAGTVIGYVGNSGDAAGGPTHDHFEWHPSSIPSSWPSSAYGYSVIGDAVNPYPLLSQVC